MTNTKFLNIKIWDGATQKFVNESPKIELLNAEGETVDTITLNFNATSCTVSDGVTILTGEAASQSTDGKMFGFTPNGTSLCLDLDNEIPADIAEKTFTQEQVDALGTSTEDASYNSLTLYVKVNGTIPEFDTVKQHYVNASGKDVAMMVNADTNKNPKV